jgi:hypothetical protein
VPHRRQMEPDWVASYYEALEFFHWEPQHIGRKKHAGAQFDSLEKVRRHLHRMEVTLDHNLYQFFLLAPSSLRNELFATLFTRRFSRPFALHGGDADGEFALENAVQPDLLFISEAEVVAIEMKLGARCSVRQVLKYALLGLAVELQAREPRKHYLALLGRGDFPRQWKEHFASVTALRIALGNADLAAFLSAQPTRFREHEGRFREIVTALDIAFINYSDLAVFLSEAAPPDSDRTPGAEVYRKLIAGMLAELRGRGLAS